MLDTNFIKEQLGILFPNAKCELDYHNIYELSVAVILSAQTSDKSVNKITPVLFSKYPTIETLANANPVDVEQIIAPLGLAKRKSLNICGFAKDVVDKFNSVVPNSIEELITLPGVGRKTANVIISEGYHLPGFAVDVHVERVTKRLGIVDDGDDPHKIELKLKKMYDPCEWHMMHHRFIFMGRYLCTSKNPMCDKCPFNNKCAYKK